MNIRNNEWNLTYSTLQAGLLLKSTKLFGSANPEFFRIYLRENSRRIVHHKSVPLILYTFKQDAVIGGFISTKSWATSSCWYGSVSPVMEVSCEKLKTRTWRGDKGWLFSFRTLARIYKPHTIRTKYTINMYPWTRTSTNCMEQSKQQIRAYLLTFGAVSPIGV